MLDAVMDQAVPEPAWPYLEAGLHDGCLLAWQAGVIQAAQDGAVCAHLIPHLKRRRTHTPPHTNGTVSWAAGTPNMHPAGL